MEDATPSGGGDAAPRPRLTDVARWRREALLVLGVSLLPSAAFAIVSIASDPIAGARTFVEQRPARVVDLVRDLLDICFALVPVLLVAHFLWDSGERWNGLTFGRRPLDVGDADESSNARRRVVRPGLDVVQGGIIAAAVGGAGLVLYIVAVHLGINRTVIPVVGDGPWWGVPVLLLRAAENAIVEEVIVGAFVLRRVVQSGWTVPLALVGVSMLRGSYHLYQGWGGFVGNVAMGLLFGVWLLRGRRLGALVIAHFLIDAVAFVGYPLVVDSWTWLPR